jgi:hypothetical protein
MAAEHVSLAQRLECGEILFYPKVPFALPKGDDLDFLLRQRQGGLRHKNISYDPTTGRMTGLARQGGEQIERLRLLFTAFSHAVTTWLAEALPCYASGCFQDRASFRPHEEATRLARPTARNDLLHVDAFPNRPARGRRILRAFVNINPSEPRIWATSEPFARLLERYGSQVGLPRWAPGWLHQLGASVLRAFRPQESRRWPSDVFMRRFHDFLKRNDEFQERGPKRLWTFPPGSAWLAMTDACTHAELRGRFALEHSYFIAPQCLVLPDASPAAILAGAARRDRAA